MSEIRRRHFLIATGALLATPFAVGAQPARRVPLLAYVANRPGPMEFDQAFLRGLREFGYIEGKNIGGRHRRAMARAVEGSHRYESGSHRVRRRAGRTDR